MQRDREPTEERHIKSSKVSNYLAALVLLEIKIDAEAVEHQKRVEDFKIEYEAQRISLDEYLSMIEESESKLNRLRDLHNEDRDEINSSL